MKEIEFKRLKNYQTGGTRDRMELKFPLPATPSGKHYRFCPNQDCAPRLFLIGTSALPKVSNEEFIRRQPGTPGKTCVYCGHDAEDKAFNYEGDIEAIKERLAWLVSKDVNDYLKGWAKDVNRQFPKNGFITLKMDVKPNNKPEPRVFREDLLRNLSCTTCGREYGVYAIAIYCPECGAKNLMAHFEREIELILQQIDMAEGHAQSNPELSYRLLGNSHEDVVTAFETYQKTGYKQIVKQKFGKDEAEGMITKKEIGNKFQNVEKAKELYAKLGIHPFMKLSEDEMGLLVFNIQKRHVIGHNLSMADEAYNDSTQYKRAGTTIEILGEDITNFALTAKKVIQELSDHLS